MRILIMGAPGAGKGTQASLIKDKYQIPHISTGNMFREAIEKQTPTGIEAQGYIEKGNLVPDSTTIKLVKERLLKDDCKHGFLLDGFPRTVAQAESLDRILNELDIKLDAVVNVVVDDSLIIERIVGRRTCVKCGEAYHVAYNKPKNDGVCDVCGASLIQRKDDSEETIKNRLAVYYSQTQPVLDYYQKQKLTKDVNGVGSIEEIFTNVVKALEA